MKLPLYPGFVGLLLTCRLLASAQVPNPPRATAAPKEDLATMEKRRAAYEAKQLLAARQALTEAPIVFLGRLVTSEHYQDKTGRYYEAQVWQVLHVLRGHDRIVAGTIRMNEIFAWYYGKPLVPPPPGKPKFMPRPIQSDYDYPGWAINFCRISDLPPSPIPYKTSNRKTLVRYTPTSYITPEDWFVDVSHGPPPVPDHGTDYCGFGFRFKTELEMNQYLRKLPDLVPIPQPGMSYPKIPFVDTRATYLLPTPALPPSESD